MGVLSMNWCLVLLLMVGVVRGGGLNWLGMGDINRNTELDKNKQHKAEAEMLQNKKEDPKDREDSMENNDKKIHSRETEDKITDKTNRKINIKNKEDILEKNDDGRNK